jgi:hypothetical protein
MIDNHEFFDLPCYFENGASYQMIQVKGGKPFHCYYGGNGVPNHNSNSDQPRFYATSNANYFKCQACLTYGRNTKFAGANTKAVKK